MQPKDRILEAALRLYNLNGIKAITTRHIAKEIAMSPGNLHYHYQHASDIILALFNKFTAEYREFIAMSNDQFVTDLEHLYLNNKTSFDIIWKYRFGFLNITEIMRILPEIKDSYNSLRKQRQESFMRIVQTFIRSGVFRKDLPFSVWESLATQLNLFADFYLSYTQTIEFDESQIRAEYCRVYEDLIFTFITGK